MRDDRIPTVVVVKPKNSDRLPRENGMVKNNSIFSPLRDSLHPLTHSCTSQDFLKRQEELTRPHRF